jgi:threonine/homoserine/homoserine lactone efflux protein
MIDLPLLLAFAAAASLLTVTPGVDTAIVLRTATLEGRRQAVLAAAGICLGCLAWGVAVSLGLGALLQASELAYTVVKFAGAAYLIWLGSRLLFKPRASFDSGPDEAPAAASGQAFWRGLLTNLLNPKVGVFYVSVHSKTSCHPADFRPRVTSHSTTRGYFHEKTPHRRTVASPNRSAA